MTEISSPEPHDPRTEPNYRHRDGSGSHLAVPGRRMKYAVLWAACALFAYGLDQLTKFWIVSTMYQGESTPVLPPLLRWHYIRNSGAAFSIGQDYTWIFTIVMVLVIVGIVWSVRRVRSLWWSVALGLLLGGAAGNLTDRLFREPSFGMGHVVDFIALPHFAIFNVADSAIVGSVILICILTFLGLGLDGGHHGREVKDVPGGAPDELPGGAPDELPGGAPDGANTEREDR